MKASRFNILFLCVSIFSCMEKKPVSSSSPGLNQKVVVDLKYAEGFTITEDSLYTWVQVKHPYQGASQGFQYLLAPRGLQVPQHPDNVRVIRTPLNSIVCTS